MNRSTSPLSASGGNAGDNVGGEAGGDVGDGARFAVDGPERVEETRLLLERSMPTLPAKQR
jgi:hypothetical protein